VYSYSKKKNQGRFRHVGSDHSLVRAEYLLSAGWVMFWKGKKMKTNFRLKLYLWAGAGCSRFMVYKSFGLKVFRGSSINRTLGRTRLRGFDWFTCGAMQSAFSAGPLQLRCSRRLPPCWQGWKARQWKHQRTLLWATYIHRRFSEYVTLSSGLSWQANNASASEEIPPPLWKPKIHYRANESRPVDHILNHMNQPASSNPIP
jgi:hypothetical protein